MLVYLHLLVHVEVGQPVVHHDDSTNIIEYIARFSGNAIPYLHGVALAHAIGQHGKLVFSFQLCLLDELTHHIGRHMTIDRIYQSYLICLNFELLLAHKLRDTEYLTLFASKLASDIEAIACACEIQYHSLLPAFDARSEGRSSRCCHHSGQCSTSHNLESRAASQNFFFHNSMCLITDAKIQTIPETAWTQISGIIYNISEKD